MVAVLVPYALVAALALFLNRLDATGCRGRRFDLLVDGTPLVLITLLYSSVLLLTGRSLFSGLLAAGGALLLFAVNRLKLSQFKEPLVFVDFGLFAQMLRHPRFYFPYIFPLPVVLTVALAVFGMAALYRMQPPLEAGTRLPWVLFYAALLPSILLLLRFFPVGERWVAALVEKRRPAFDPNTDFAAFGLTGSLLLHALAHAHRPGRDGEGGAMPRGRRSPECVWPPAALAPASGEKPHVVLIQAESFFDLRRADPGIDPSVYANFDRLRGEGVSGEMRVSAHGAYTMRTEFSVLTGIPNGKLGTDAMNPYLSAARRRIWSLADHFRKQGYRCVCVHPYDLKFFRRDKVMPNLGFDELHGEALFSSAERIGPYVGDEVLAEYLLSLLEKSGEPLFIFAITIEAHGPWDGDRFKDMPTPPEPVAAPGWGGPGMAAYLTHLRDTDRMLGMLADAPGHGRDRVIALYGDHVGCVPEDRPVNGNTDYLVWSGRRREAVQRDIRAEEIGGLVAGVARETTKTD